MKLLILLLGVLLLYLALTGKHLAFWQALTGQWSGGPQGGGGGGGGGGSGFG